MAVQYITLRINILIIIVNSAQSNNLEGYIVGGVMAKIKDFPHVGLLAVECSTRYETGYYTCGSSIINQAIVITAAHCLDNCRSQNSRITVFVGNCERMRGSPYLASSYKIHEEYDDVRVRNDIGLVRLRKKLRFDKNVKRVALMRRSPKRKHGRVAGWGFTDAESRRPALHLMQIKQEIWSLKECIKELYGTLDMPMGSICGGYVEGSRYVSLGDSGSGLVVKKFILVGIVSYKISSISESIAVYTDVSYFYDWVKNTAKTLFCET